MRDLLFGLAAGGPAAVLALDLAESLVEKGRFDPVDVLWRYAETERSAECDTGLVGGRVLRRVREGFSVSEALALTGFTQSFLSGDPGPALRVAPLAAAAFLDDEALWSAARVEAELTNHHPGPTEASRVVAMLLRELLRGRPWDESVAAARQRCGPEMQRALVLGRHITLDSERSAPSLLRTAIHFVDQSNDLASALNYCRNFTQDSTWHLALVSALGCARYGWSAVAPVHDEPRAQALADALGAGW